MIRLKEPPNVSMEALNLARSAHTSQNCLSGVRGAVVIVVEAVEITQTTLPDMSKEGTVLLP